MSMQHLVVSPSWSTVVEAPSHAAPVETPSHVAPGESTISCSIVVETPSHEALWWLHQHEAYCGGSTNMKHVQVVQ